MKKVLVLVGTILVFSAAEGLLDIVLGIKFPSSGANIIHSLLLVANGGVLVMIAYAKI
ncbi:MAG: hypothetical protein AAB939_00555 [Patescibacteria group bacterium]